MKSLEDKLEWLFFVAIAGVMICGVAVFVLAVAQLLWRCQ